jgi:diguanylate cyclase (GGDEF)-like protein
METLETGNSGNAALANPPQTHGTVIPAPSENLGSRVLGLASILQTTLEISQQLSLFGKELGRYVEFDGLIYSLPNNEKTHLYGREASERATYSLVLQDVSLGKISACRDEAFSDTEMRTLEDLLCALIYPLRNALSYKQAVEMASRDTLTGAQNRMAMTTALPREIELARRQNQPLSMLVIDIDHFKRFNDRHGHAFGDDVLVATAQTIASTVRRCDLLYRFGGEEFVVLASHTDHNGALLLAERIRENIAAMHSIRGRATRITVSIGAAQLGIGDDADSFFERADRALYVAKDNGRNQCSIAD